MPYSVIVVEDELPQQRALGRWLNHESDLAIIATARCCAEAVTLLEAHRPDLVFMDIMLGGENTFDMLSNLNTIPFRIIFTTAHNEFAVRAFRFSAIDFLLKPISTEDFRAAVMKFRHQVDAHNFGSRLHNLLTNLRKPAGSHRIALPTLKGFLFLEVSELIRCEADNTYTTFFTTGGQRIIVSRTIKEVEQCLNETDYRFCRVHHSALINLDYVVEYMKGDGGWVKMMDGAEVEVSRRRKSYFLNMVMSL